MTRLLFCCFAFVFVQNDTAFARQHFIDSQESFNAFENAKVRPGDAVLLKRGMRFDGALTIEAHGTEEKPIQIGAYGVGSRPRIDANGRHLAGLLLKNPSFVEVDGLETTNTDGSDKDQGTLFGIYVLASGTEGIYRHVYINNCFVHDVNGKVAGKKRGGIHVHIQKLKASVFDDLRITNNRIEDVGGVGIGNDSSCGNVKLLRDSERCENLWSRVYVADNHVDRTGRNNIIARVSKDAIYERNTLANSSRYDTGHSIFCFKTNGIKIQYNEAYGNVGDEGMDRGGFDADYHCVDTFIQYNYSHDNNWFCGIMKRPNRNVVIRYNLSQNDRKGIYFYGFQNDSKAENIHIYNNTHFVKRGLDVKVFPEGRTPINTKFENNIFYFQQKGRWGKRAAGRNVTFHNNLYFNLSPHPSDSKPIVANTKFINPGKVGFGIDLKTMSALQGYQLKKGSPCINTGVKILGNGGRDIRKKAIDSRGVDVGAFEY